MARRIPEPLSADLIERRSLIFNWSDATLSSALWFGRRMGMGTDSPLVLLLSYTFIFKICLNMRLGPHEVYRTSAVSVCPACCPGYCSATRFCSSSSLIDRANLITKTVFPAEVVPVSIFVLASQPWTGPVAGSGGGGAVAESGGRDASSSCRSISS